MECFTTKQFAWRIISLEIGAAKNNILLKSMLKEERNEEKIKTFLESTIHRMNIRSFMIIER